MTEKYFIFPVDDDSNERIAKHSGMLHVEPEWNAQCYIGDAEIYLPLYSMPNRLIFDSFKKSKVSFYAFIEKNDRKQFFKAYKTAGKEDKSELVAKVAALVKKLEEIQNQKK